MRIYTSYTILILLSIFCIPESVKSIDFVSANTVCGAGAVEITFSNEVDPKTVNYLDFKVQGNINATSKDRIPVAGAYVDPYNPKRVVVYLYKQAIRWIPNAVAYSTVNISYSGTSLKDITGVTVPVFTSMTVNVVNTLNNSSVYVQPLPENFAFEQDLWAKDQSKWVITDTIHVNNKNAQASDLNIGSRELPLKTISKAISLGGGGKVILVHNGVYPEELVIPLNKSGTINSPFILQGENVDSVLVYGNDNWSDSTWVQSGNYWVSHWPYNWGLNFDAATVPNELGRHRENLYVNGIKYDQVLALSNMRPRTYYVNVAEGKIYLQLSANTTPKMVKIEVSTRSNGITIGDPWNPLAWVSYFVIKNIQVSYFNNLNTIQGKHYLVENCKFQWNNDEGANTGGFDYMLKNCLFTYNGRSGIDIPPRLNASSEYFSVNGLIENCEMNNNNWRVGIYGGQRGWFLGGAKVHGCVNLIFRGCSFKNNAAPGLWMDNKVNNALVEDCLVANNSESGIWSEIGYGNTIIRNNVITKNNSGITMSNTGFLRIEGNIIADNSSDQIGSWEPNQNREEAFKSIFPTFKHNAMFGNYLYNIPKWSSLYSTIVIDSNYYQNKAINSYNGLTFSAWKSQIQKSKSDVISESNSVIDNFLFRNETQFDFVPQFKSQLANSPQWAFVNIVSLNDSTYTLESNKTDIEIRYSTNGFLPTKNSPVYSSQIILKKGQTLAARAYRLINDSNNIYSPVSFATNAQQLNVKQLEITAQSVLTTFEEVPILIKNTDVTINSDAFLIILPGDNYTVHDNVVTPVTGFIGDLQVNAKAVGFNGAIPSNTFMIKVSVLQGTNALSTINFMNVSIYPNPCNNILNINFESDKSFEISIFNTNGQLVFDKNITNSKELTINTTSLAVGIYFMRIKSDNNVHNFKFSKK